jgi:hypothetical protein
MYHYAAPLVFFDLLFIGFSLALGGGGVSARPHPHRAQFVPVPVPSNLRMLLAGPMLGLLQLYVAMTPPKVLFHELQRTDSRWASMEFQASFVRGVLASPIAKRYPPSKEYTKFLLRLYIDAIAKHGEEYDDEIMEIYSALCIDADALPVQQAHEDLVPDSYYRSFFLADGSPLTLQLHKGYGAESTGGTGATLWEAGLVLCDYVCANPSLFSGKNVLELGAGNGMLGVVLSRLPDPPASIVLTDHHPKVLDLMEKNLRMNGVNIVHDWRPCPLHDAQHLACCPDDGAPHVPFSDTDKATASEEGNDMQCGGGGRGPTWPCVTGSLACACALRGKDGAGAASPASEASTKNVRTVLLDWEVCSKEYSQTPHEPTGAPPVRSWADVDAGGANSSGLGVGSWSLVFMG